MQDEVLKDVVRILLAIQGRIVEHPSFARGYGSLPDDVGNATELRDLTAMQAALGQAVRKLKAQESRLNLSELVARRAPKDHRRRHRQALDHDRRTLGSVYKLAADVLRDLETLCARNATVSLADLVVAIKQQHDEKSEQQAKVDQLVHIVTEHRAHFENIRLPTPTVQNVPLNFILVLVIAYLGIKAKLDRIRA